jgi:transcriptional regulator with AAA-type ATPase domain
VNESFTTTQDLTSDVGLEKPSPKPFLFVVLQGDEPVRAGARVALFGSDVVTLGRGSKREIVRERLGEVQVRLPSPTVSKEHARITRRGNDWYFEDLNSRNGSCINGQRVTNAVIRSGDWIEVGSVLLRYRADLPTLSEVSGDSDLNFDKPAIRGYSSLVPAVEASFRALSRVAHSPITTLLLGETGTGKELLARGMHNLSGRTGPFVAVNCGALASSYIESHLFGHVKGSFAGAFNDEPGLIRSADKGTLFLDEVADLPFPAQATLLRVLQEREVLPVGGSRATEVDVRIVAATNKPLEALCLQGEFRADLMARLSGYQHSLVPLRERFEDFGIIIGDLLLRSNVPNSKTFRIHLDVMRRLVLHGWPLNVRELEHLLSLAQTLAERNVMELSHLPATITKFHQKPTLDNDLVTNPDELRNQIIQLLEQYRGNVTSVARARGKSRMQLHRWMQKFEIDPETYRAAGGDSSPNVPPSSVKSDKESQS